MCDLGTRMQYWATIGPSALRWWADSGSKLHAGCIDSPNENKEIEFARTNHNWFRRIVKSWGSRL